MKLVPLLIAFATILFACPFGYFLVLLLLYPSKPTLESTTELLNLTGANPKESSNPWTSLFFAYRFPFPPSYSSEVRSFEICERISSVAIIAPSRRTSSRISSVFLSMLSSIFKVSFNPVVFTFVIRSRSNPKRCGSNLFLPQIEHLKVSRLLQVWPVQSRFH